MTDQHAIICTCPSGDGSLRYPCPVHASECTAHPAAAQEAVAWRIDGPAADGSTFTQFETDSEFANLLRRAGIEISVSPLYAAPVAAAPSFQAGVSDWMARCFVPSLYSNMTERGDRLLEEVLELLQAHGYDPTRVATLVDYVFKRPVGQPAQEVGGVMVTLAAYCWVAGLDMHAAGNVELARINQPAVMAKIRAKQETKNALHFDTPLPGPSSATSVDTWFADQLTAMGEVIPLASTPAAPGIDLEQFREAVLAQHAALMDSWCGDPETKEAADKQRDQLLALIDASPKGGSADERARFEAWAKEQGRYILEPAVHRTDRYYWSETQGAWEAWQAAMQATSAEAGA